MYLLSTFVFVDCIMFDLSSHGHTKVNDRQVSYAHLQHGDKISLGSVTEYFFYIEKRSKVMNAVRHASRSSFRTPRRFRPPDRTRSASAVNRHLSASVPRQRNDAWKSHSLRRAHSEMRESSAPGAENAALSGENMRLGDTLLSFVYHQRHWSCCWWLAKKQKLTLTRGYNGNELQCTHAPCCSARFILIDFCNGSVLTSS